MPPCTLVMPELMHSVQVGSRARKTNFILGQHSRSLHARASCCHAEARKQSFVCRTLLFLLFTAQELSTVKQRHNFLIEQGSPAVLLPSNALPSYPGQTRTHAARHERGHQLCSSESQQSGRAQKAFKVPHSGQEHAAPIAKLAHRNSCQPSSKTLHVMHC